MILEIRRFCGVGTPPGRRARRRSDFPMSMRQAEPLQDGHGRVIGDLRVSVTDRCNFRCQYCMPAEGLPWLDRERDPALRGDRAPGPAVRLDGRHRRAPDRRRAARAARLPALVAHAGPDRRPRRPLADHQRLPARGHGGRPCRSRPAAHQRVARLTLARPLLPDHAARLAAAGDPRARGARAPPRAGADQGQLRGDARLHRGGGASVRRARAPQALPRALHRVHAARRRPRVVGGPRPDRARRSAR